MKFLMQDLTLLVVSHIVILPATDGEFMQKYFQPLGLGMHM